MSVPVHARYHGPTYRFVSSGPGGTTFGRATCVTRHTLQLQQRFSFESELIFVIPNHSNHHLSIFNISIHILTFISASREPPPWTQDGRSHIAHDAYVVPARRSWGDLDADT